MTCDQESCIYPLSAQLGLLLTSQIDALSQDIHVLMSSNILYLNSLKAQLIWFGIPLQLQKLDIDALLSERFPQFTILLSVRDLDGCTLLPVLIILLNLLTLPTSN